MKCIGIDFDANRLNYVVVNGGNAGDTRVVTSGKLTLEDSRDADAVRTFSVELAEILGGISPDVIAIKSKPENGQMRAGASALKMEALLLVRSSCPVYFLSAQRVEKAAEKNDDLYAYQQSAWKAAVSALDGPPKKAAPKKAKPKAK
jgi:Holliday junction resolvasome RuvABC endonuclease subunit